MTTTEMRTLYKKGLSMAEIGNLAGMTRQAVHSRLSQKKWWRGRKKWSELSSLSRHQKKKIVALYHKLGAGTAVAEHTGLKTSTVYAVLNKEGLP